MYVQKLFWRVKNLPLLHKTIGISLIVHVCVMVGMLIQRVPAMIKLTMNERRFVAAEVLFDDPIKKGSMLPERVDRKKNEKSMINEQIKAPPKAPSKKQDAKKEAALKKAKERAEKAQAKKEALAKKKKVPEAPQKTPPVSKVVTPSPIKTKEEKAQLVKWTADMPVAYEIVVAEIKKAIEAVWQLPKNVAHVACVVSITLSNLGKVLDIQMVKSSEVPAFDLAVLASTKKATFPASCWGRTIEITIG